MSWDKLGYFEKLEWTQAFLDFPPVFLGVHSMLVTMENAQRLQPSTNRAWIEEISMLVECGFDPRLYLYVMFSLHAMHAENTFSREQIKRLFAPGSETGRPDGFPAEKPDPLPRRLKPSVVALIARAYACGLRPSVILDQLLRAGTVSLRKRVIELEKKRDEFLESLYLTMNLAVTDGAYRRRARERTNLKE